MSSNFFFDRILKSGGITPEEFSKKYWCKKPLFIKSAIQEPGDFFSKVDFEEALNRNYPWKWHVTKDISEVYKSNNEPVRGNPDLSEISGPQAKSLREMDMFIIANEPERTNENIATFIASINTAIPAPTKKYDTYFFQSSFSQGIAIHNDPHEIFIVQLVGEKKWRYADCEFPLPVVVAKNSENLYYVTSGYQEGEMISVDDSSFNFSEIVMEPGDFLYLPKHVLHTTSGNSQYSLSLNIQRIGESFFSLIEDMIKKNDIDSHKKIFMATEVQDSGKKIKKYLQKKLMQVVDYLEKQESDYFETAMANLSMWPYDNGYVYKEKKIPKNINLTLDSTIQRDPNLMINSNAQSKSNKIFINGIEISFQEKKWRFLIKFLANPNPIRTGTLLVEGGLKKKDWLQLKERLDTLIDLGLINVFDNSMSQNDITHSA